MSTDDSQGVPYEILSRRERKDPIVLPQNPSDEELARDWTLSKEDLGEVLRSRGDDHRRRFATQLLVLRKYGRFLENYVGVPVRILTYVSRQMDLEPTLFLGPPERSATETDHADRIRQYLGWRSFGGGVYEQLERWLWARAIEGIAPRELYARAEKTLHSWKVVLPAPSTLERVVGSAQARAGEEAFDRIVGQLPARITKAIDELLEVPEGDHRSGLFRLKAYPPEASAQEVAAYIERYEFLESIGVGEIDVSAVGPELAGRLAEMTKRYDVRELRRFRPAKRLAMVASFLTETRKTVLDHVVEMHDEFMTKMCRKSRNIFEARHRAFRKRAKEGVDTLLQAVDILLDPRRPRQVVLTELFLEVEEPMLRQAAQNLREFKRLEERGYLDELSSRYSNLRRYLPNFFRLPLRGESGSEPILKGIELVAKLDRGELSELPVDAPVAFVPASWRAGLEQDDGTLDRKTWEIALALAVREGLRSGDVYLSQSRRHVSFSDFLYKEPQWAQARERAYKDMDLPTQADPLLARLGTELDQVARQALQGLSENPFAQVEGDRLKLKKPDALEIPPSAQQLKAVLKTQLAKIRIENLLLEVATRTGFLTAFEPLAGYEPRSENHEIALLAAIVAHGTNLGIAAMGASAEGITADMLQHVSRHFLREETLSAANAMIVNCHARLPITSVWGDGTISSSDAQRFGIRQSSLIGSIYPRHFGYYQPAVSVYTHVSDQHSVFSTKVISCAPREALYVLDGLLENSTILRPREHTTDTGGYVEILFALCWLLGISFVPRIKDLADQQIYKVDRTARYGRLDSLFHGGVDLELIREQWDPMVRVAASLKNRTAPAYVVIQRLLTSTPSDRLAKALREVGRIRKTIWILRYIQDEDSRRRVQLQLNRGESRHALGRWLFFADQGEFRVGDYEEIMNKASCLSLLSNAVLVSNTVKIAEIVEGLRKAGQVVLDDDLAKISPLMWGHVIPNGTYHFRRPIRGVDVS